ncbi:hypothetical protein HMPREF9946_02146 [Acetobacteraceae bacterium AT-5844]|nr:hypothetical protein HMPREF9946_02146 [Acetobacteraceae bacterium AT-5844]
MTETSKGFFPAREALIAFNTNDKFQVTEVYVFQDLRGSPAWSEGPPWELEKAHFTYGAFFTKWMNGDHDMTPEWVFSNIIAFNGCADSLVLERAIREFAKIEECGWARAMLPDPRPVKPSWRLS